MDTDQRYEHRVIVMDIRRRRIRVLVDAWSDIMHMNVKTREEAVDILKRVYEEAKIEPIRGASNPPDLFDKEMISLYIIGKWGLGIDKELSPEFLNSVFWKELLVERVINALDSVENEESLCCKVPELREILDDNFVARTLRFAFTLYYFGFRDEEWFRNILRKVYKVLSRYEETVRRFVKFYIAYKVGEGLERNEIKNRMELNIAKNLLALELSIPKAVPSNSYVLEVAKYYFNLPKKVIEELRRE